MKCSLIYILIFIFQSICGIAIAGRPHSFDILQNVTSIDNHGSLFDDFSYDACFPADSLWINSGVTVSRDLPVLPPTLGVAVFDALDSEGNFHKGASYSSVSGGDTLTSKPLNLYLPADNTVYLSFLYQSGGFANIPDNADSLCLDFYSPEADQWVNVWKTSETTGDEFKRVIINISGKTYLQDGFQFRLRNKFSLGTSKEPSLVADCDFWYVDCVKLSSGRTENDTILKDIAFTRIPEIKFGNFSQVPALHYYNNPENFQMSLLYNYRNNDNQVRLIDVMNFVAKSDTVDMGSANMPYYQDFSNTIDNFKYTFKISDTQKESVFDLKVYLVSDDYDFKQNDTVRFQKTFDDCYAYDDGTPEAGYGITGEGTSSAMAAVKYSIPVEGKIYGVKLYFCKTFNNAQSDYLSIKVWNDNNGVPGSVICALDNVSLPKDSTDKFVYFKFAQAVDVGQTFYIGWQKTQSEIINIGLDLSSQYVKNVKFFNVGGQWKQSSTLGNIMIRPSLGDFENGIDDINPYAKESKNSFYLYPNPAKDKSYLTINDENIKLPADIYIYSASGQIEKILTADDLKTEINVSDITSGLKIIKLKGCADTKKIIVVK